MACCPATATIFAWFHDKEPQLGLPSHGCTAAANTLMRDFGAAAASRVRSRRNAAASCLLYSEVRAARADHPSAEKRADPWSDPPRRLLTAHFSAASLAAYSAISAP